MRSCWWPLWLYARRYPGTVGLRDALQLLPDLLRLLQGLITDKAVQRGVRVKLALLLVYLLIPVDLVPDFLPVIGYADDIIILAVALRFAVRSAGPEPLRRHWQGTTAGLAFIEKLAGLRSGGAPSLPGAR